MAQTVKLKRSATAGNIPTISQLDLGEIGINTRDGKLFIKTEDAYATQSIREIGQALAAQSISDLSDVYVTSPQSNQILSWSGTSWINTTAAAGGTDSELEKVTEGSNTGWRILGRDPLNYGDIGPGAIDLSYSPYASTTHGATGENSFATGEYNTASGKNAFATGLGTTASGIYASAFGGSSYATGDYSHAEGSSYATGDYSHSEGFGAAANGDYSHAEGQNTEANLASAHAEGDGSTANGTASHAEGDNTTASGNASHAEGSYCTTASAAHNSHAEGWNTSTGGVASHAEGYYTTATGKGSHAEGWGYTTSLYAVGIGSHAEGHVKSTGTNIAGPGYTTISSIGDGSHVEGQARGYYSTTLGTYTTTQHKALGEASHAEGINTIAQNETSHAAGRLNIGTSPDTIHETGIGSYDEPTNTVTRKNAFEIYTDGTLTAPESTIALITTRGNKTLATKEYVDDQAGGNSTRTVEKILGDGTTSAFTLTNVYVVGAETLVDVFIDGLLQIEGTQEDYVLSSSDTLTFNSIPSNNSIIIVKVLI